MRSTKNRSRGNKNRNRPSGSNIINRVFDSNGPEGKVRGTPQQIIEKYAQLHRDAALSGDRVNAENFAQHGEHYTRLLAEAQREVDARRIEQEEQNRQRQAERDRERADRMKAQEETSGTGEQPEVVDAAGSDMVVDTPENRVEASESVVSSAADEAPKDVAPTKPKRRPRTRKPAAPAPSEAAAVEAD